MNKQRHRRQQCGYFCYQRIRIRIQSLAFFRTSITVKTVEQTRIRKRGLECPIKKHANNAVNLSKVFYYIFLFFKIKFPVNGSRKVGGQHFWWILWSLMHKICTCAAVAFTRWKLLKSFSSVWIVLNQLSGKFGIFAGIYLSYKIWLGNLIYKKLLTNSGPTLIRL